MIDDKKHTSDAKPVPSVMNTVLPPELTIWYEARRLCGDPNMSVDELAACIAQDPVLVIEFLKIANGMSIGGTKQTTTTIKGSIIRLGSEFTIDTLNSVEARTQLSDPGVSNWFETHRSRCTRTAIIARMIAEVQAKHIADECQVAGLLSFVGELIAVAHFREKYVKIAENNTRTGTIFRLATDFKFDVRSVGFSYLTKQGLPQIILSALDQDSSAKSGDKMIMKPIVASANELIDAFDSGKWGKYAPGKLLPSKSPLRLLSIQESQYTKIYERATQYLFLTRQQDEKKRYEKETKVMQRPTIEEAPPAAPAAKKEDISERQRTISNLNDEINNLLSFSFTDIPTATTSSFEIDRSQIAAETPPVKTKSIQTIVTSIASELNNASNSEELLSSILDKLITSGPFEKTALIVVAKDKTHAKVVAARGPNIGSGQQINISDPLSPLAQSFSKVRSFGKQSSDVSPFGSNSFAVAPIDAQYENPVALYADCGSKASITFEARRVFRSVVELLNEKLPTLPGGIPVEFDKK
mgnify:CR=1 FL=1